MTWKCVLPGVSLGQSQHNGWEHCKIMHFTAEGNCNDCMWTGIYSI